MTLKHAALGLGLALMITVPALAQGPCDHVTLAWISTQASLPQEARIVHAAGKLGVCEVVLAIDGNLVPVYAGKDYLLAGQMFSQGKSLTKETMDGLSDVAEAEKQMAKEKEALAVEKRQRFFKENAGELDSLVSLTFGPGSAKEDIYVVTDPRCSHCKALMPDLEEAAFEAKVKLRLVIYPVLGPKSRIMAEHAICEAYDWEAYKNMAEPETPRTCKVADQRLDKTMTLMQAADVSFVPLVMAKDGSWVVEGSDICAVRTHLGLKNKDGEKGDGSGCSPEK